jgi:hypothetical protein
MQASTKPLLGSIAAGSAALLSMGALFGFTVDDALISARVAHQLGSGHGYRFNPSGPIVDAVTPLGWAPLLAPFASRGVLPAFEAARAIGLLAWLLAAAWLGTRLVQIGRRALLIGCVCLAVTTPLGAWAVSGMETGLVMALATFALGAGGTGRLALGLAVALRPELLPWAVTLVIGRAVAAERSAAARVSKSLIGVAATCAPFIAVAVVRTALFGSAYPLALVAKPPELDAGLRYALGALALSGPPWLLLAWRGWAGVRPESRAIALAAAVHVLSLILAGGDWMPLYRLFVPVLPGLILVGAELAEPAPRALNALRLTLLLMVTALIAVALGPSSRRVWERRLSLISAARPLLAGARRPATVDIGWVGAATDAPVVDLAGVSDPMIARLPGGHTTKRLPDGLLEAREVDALVLLADRPELSAWPALAFVRAVDARVVSLASADRFKPVGLVPLLGTTQAYVIARKPAP